MEKVRVYESILNGRVPNNGTEINSIEKITYYNPTSKKNQTQSYLDMDDIIIPFIIRQDENGNYQFALEYRFIPSLNTLSLELPVISTMKNNANYTKSELITLLDEELMNTYGIDLEGISFIESLTPISQSFTNQKLMASIVHTNKTNNSNLCWFNIDTLEDYLQNHTHLSSLQTVYIMNLVYEKLKNLITTNSTFKYDIVETTKMPKYKNLMEHKYRFGVDMLSRNENDNALIGLSKNSVQCIMIKTINGRHYVGLSKQQRSPFIALKNFDEYLYEISAGMVEENESYEEAAKKEAYEETGIDISQLNLTYIDTLLLSTATQEKSAFYICEIPENQEEGLQQLDSDENIGQIQWIDIDSIDLSDLHSPLPTKYAILKAKEYLNNQKQEKSLN